MKFIEYISEEAVDEYLNDVKNNTEKVEEKMKDLITHYAPGTIVYQLGWAAVNQFTTQLFLISPQTGQDTMACK